VKLFARWRLPSGDGYAALPTSQIRPQKVRTFATALTRYVNAK